MLLGKEAILHELSKANIIVNPYSESLVGANSISVRLGRDMWHNDIPHTATQQVINPYTDNDKNWVKCEPLKINDNSFILFANHYGLDKSNLTEDDELFIIYPGNFYLGTTLEKIGTANHSALVPEIKAKSTIGRYSLTVALCATLGNEGYHNQWALEIRNGTKYPIIIAVGTLVAEVIFHQSTHSSEYKSDYIVDDKAKILPKPLKIMRK